MCHKILLFNFDESKNSAKEHKFLMSKIWEIAFCVPSLFRRHVCLPNLKDSPSRELPLTARKTVFSHLNMSIRSIKGEGGLVITLFYFQNFNICKSSSEEECFYILQKCNVVLIMFSPWKVAYSVSFALAREKEAVVTALCPH